MEKQLPQNVGAEQGLLGSLIIDPAAYDEVADIVSEHDFYRESHRAIYSVIAQLNSRRIPADFITVCDELEHQDRLEEIGGPGFVTSLINQVPTSGNVVYYATIVARCALNRRLIHVGGQIAAAAYTEQENALEIADKLLFDASTQHAGQDFAAIGETVNDCMTDLMQVYEKRGTLIGVPTGFADLDHYLGGLQRSDLIVFAARPRVGKSSLMLSMIHNAVYQFDQRIAIFSLEMSKKQLTQRLLAQDAHVDLYRLRNGWIEDHEWEKLLQSRERLHTDRLMIDDTGGITLAALRSKARRLKSSRGLDALFVDYLQLMHADSGNKNRNREQEIAELSGGLKELAKELNVPVVALAQLSRAVENRQSKVPQLSDLRESGAIENDADVVLFIDRPEVYDPGANKGLADIIVAKHRNGPDGTVRLRWIGAETRFENLEASA